MRRSFGSFLAVLVLLSGLLGACASAAPPPTPAPAAAPAAPAARPTEAPRPTTAPAAAAPKAAQPSGAQPAATAAAAAPGSGTANAPAVPWDRMIIRTTTLSLTVSSVEDTIEAIRALAVTNEGYVSQLQSSYKGDQMVATVTVQVPAQAFDGVVQQVRRLAVKVETEQTTSQDVTEEFADTQSQMRNLQSTEQSLLKLMDKAQKMEDILTIQRELTNVRGQIEKLQGRMNYLQRRSDMSTLIAQLATVPPKAKDEPPTEEPGWQPLRTIERAWRASIKTVSGIADVLLAVAVYTWWLWPFVALAGWLIRRRSLRRPAQRAPAPPGSPEPPAASAAVGG